MEKNVIINNGKIIFETDDYDEVVKIFRIMEHGKKGGAPSLAHKYSLSPNSAVKLFDKYYRPWKGVLLMAVITEEIKS